MLSPLRRRTVVLPLSFAFVFPFPLALALVAPLFLVGCRGAAERAAKSGSAEEAQNAPTAAPVGGSAAGAQNAPVQRAAAPAGSTTLTGTVTVTGTPPEMRMLKRDGDPECARHPMKEEEVVVGTGGLLKNALVRLTAGVTGSYDPPAGNATLDQTGCMYRPRVQGVIAGQSLLIKNSDQTLHNVHTYRGASTLFNQAQVPGLPPMAKKFNDAGDIIKFKCDVHPWMTGYVAVSNHPFFAVTDDQGRFDIAKVPPGRYTVEAWHERLGTAQQEVTVAANQPTVEVKFALAAR